MKNILLATVAVALISTPAFAKNDNGNNGNSNGTTNVSASPVAQAQGVGVGIAGAYAQGGNATGGSAVAQGGAGGSVRNDTSVVGINTNTVRTENTNLNVANADVRTNVNTTDLNSNLQGQLQGQSQRNSQGQDQGQGQDQTQTASVAQSGNSRNSVAVDGNNASQTTVYNEAVQHHAPVNTAYAAPTIVGGGVCAYTPLSAGLSLRIFSASGSGAVIDKGCENRANADVLARLGYVEQAAALLMQNEAVQQAFAVVAEGKKKAAQ